MKVVEIATSTSVGSTLSAVSLRAERVRSLLNMSIEMHLKIAKEIRAAKDQFTKFEYKEFLKQATLTNSIADKLLKVADTQFLYSTRAENLLSRVEGWTTLYEVSKIDVDRIDDFLTVVDGDSEQQITRKFINNYREMSAVSNDDNVTVATIIVSKKDFLRLDTEQYECFRNSLDEVQRLIDAACRAVQMKQHKKSLEELELTLFNQPIIDHDELIEADEKFLSVN